MTDVKLTEPRLTHVALPVSDLDASIAFYTELCNLVCVAQNEDENGRGAWLSNDKQVKDPFVLVLAEFLPEVGKQFGQTPGEKVPTLTPFAHVGIELPTREDVERLVDKAREMGCLQWEPRDMAAERTRSRTPVGSRGGCGLTRGGWAAERAGFRVAGRDGMADLLSSGGRTSHR